MAIWDRLFKRKPPASETSTECLAKVEALIDRREIDAALEAARRWLERPSGEDDDALLLRLRAAGLLRMKNQLEPARAYAESAVSAIESRHGLRSRLGISALLSLGELAMAMDDTERAFFCARAAMEGAEALFDQESADFAAVLIHSATFSAHIGELEPAAQLLGRAWTILERLEEDQGYRYAVAANFASVYRALGDTKLAASWKEAAARLAN